MVHPSALSAQKVDGGGLLNLTFEINLNTQHEGLLANAFEMSCKRKLIKDEAPVKWEMPVRLAIRTARCY